MNTENPTIFQCDNFHILRLIDSETVDLIHLNPLFSSNRPYEVPIGNEAATQRCGQPQSSQTVHPARDRDTLVAYRIYLSYCHQNGDTPIHPIILHTQEQSVW